MKKFALTLAVIVLLFCSSCSSEVLDSKKAQFFMLCSEPNSLMNSFVIKTKNDRVIVIDGGGETLGEAYLPSAIRAILGLGQDDYFEIEAWFISHLHNDHYTELSKVLSQYQTSNLKIKHIYYNAPSLGNTWSSPRGTGDDDLPSFAAFKDSLLNYCKAEGFVTESETDSDVAFDYLNNGVVKGQKLIIDGFKFEILQTWSQDDETVNSTSLIMKMSYQNHDVLFLGDAYIDTGARLLQNYESSELKCEYVQLGHHGQGGPSKEFYDAIDAKNSKRLWCTPTRVWNSYIGYYEIYQTRTWFNLPAHYNDYLQQGYDKTGNDFVTALYSCYPNDLTLVSDWTEKVLSEQLVAQW